MLAEDLKDSNRQQADHIHVKMRAIRREVLRRPSGREGSESRSEEFQRWPKTDDSRDRNAEINSEHALLSSKDGTSALGAPNVGWTGEFRRNKKMC